MRALMVVFRCTRALLDRLPAAEKPATSRSTTALGDWYFNVLIGRPQWLLIGVSERTRLPVVMRASELSTMSMRFRDALGHILEDLGVSSAAIAAGLAAMRDISISRTLDRRVIGSLTEFGHAVRWAIEDGERSPLHALSLRLARIRHQWENAGTCL